MGDFLSDFPKGQVQGMIERRTFCKFGTVVVLSSTRLVVKVEYGIYIFVRGVGPSWSLRLPSPYGER